ncbi:probable RNA helicase SDE3 [Pistacia vera]|uniref:probable RNA helicase SDE3 n=1 Tax=Pistacia vera TaxID=55513 RepID=UPI001262D724|nr:probable RNA helicase SDE3 [Pistacia vera]
MSVFLEILRCILCCDDEFHHGDYDETSQRDPFLQSASYDISVRSNSARSCNHLQGQSDPKIYYQTLSSSSLAKQTPPSFNPSVSSSKPYSSFSNSTSHSSKPLSSVKVGSSPICNDLLRQPDPTIIYCYEDYPNLSISNSTAKEPNAASLQSNLRRAPEVSKSSAKHTSTATNSLSSAAKTPKSVAQSSPLPKPAIPSSSIASSSSSFGKSLSSDQPLLSQSPSRQAPPSSKPTLSALPIHSTNQHTQANYTVTQKATSPIYMIPKNIENLIQKDIVPDVLKKPLSPTTYKDYFAALLYAEDFYTEKWSEFKLFSVTLKFHKATIYNKPPKNEKLKGNDEKQDKMFVAFEVDSVPERRPFLLARDFVYARRLGSTVKQFQGLIYRVVKSNIVLVEFEEDFYSQHHSERKYDISFSFNRVCLKRAHQAIAAASDPLSHNYLFPDGASRKNNPPSPPNLYRNYKLGSDQTSAVHHILNFQGSPPYLLEGPLSVTESQLLSKTGIVVREAVLQIYRSSPRNRILICAPINRTCDVLIRSLRKEIPESDMFRANAAFREVDGVPVDILPLCLYEGECFSCPSVQKLRQFRVIFSTFVSSSRLHNEGITAGHFSHIFLVDDSSATEPETMIALGNLANENTSVIVSGAPHNYSSWVRSDIARKKGLRISYFQRLRENKTYKSLEPMFITRL